jgi:serine protease Do
MPTRQLFQSVTLAGALILGSAIGVHHFVDSQVTFAQTPHQDSRQNQSSDQRDLQHAFALSDAFKSVSRAVGPAVVNIRSTQHLRATQRPTRDQQDNDDRSLSPDDMLRRFFGDQLAPDDARPMPRERVGEGSGIVVREDGYILTNNHVVDQADEILVVVDDDREFKGSVVGRDPETDLAVVRVDATGLTAAKFGDSDRLEQGDWVLAMGSPFGLEHTVTAGIVSAKGRQIGIIRGALGSGFEDFIQTDAAINPGNSGGPLVNLYGEIVGINTAIETRSGGYQGVGFAIPSKIAQNVMTSIIEKGHVERGWLGVGIQQLNRDLAESYGLSNTHGALVSEVRPGTPAQKAGLKTDDIIVAVNGQQIATSSQLMNMVAATAPGSKITLDVIRNGDHRSIDVVLGERNPENATARNDQSETEGSSNFGLAVKPLTADAARQLNAANTEGVLVARVDTDSPAGRAGIQAGDIITRVGNSDIRSVEDFNSVMAKQDSSRPLRIHVLRDGVPQVLALKPSRQ